MFGARKREGKDSDGLCWEKVDNMYYLKRILEKENEILNTLKSIDNNIVKYFGEEYEPKERELSAKIKDAKFNKEQFEILKETVAYTKEKHSKGVKP